MLYRQTKDVRIRERAQIILSRPLGQPYSAWTLQRLADFMAEETGIRVSDTTVRRILADYDIIMSRPQQKVSSPDPEYMEKNGDRRAARQPKRW